MENSVTIKNNLMPQENEFQMLQVVARNAAASGLYNGAGSEQKIFMILLAARELGIPPMQALNGGLWNIQGKIEISARLMNSMIRRAGHSITISHCDATKCVMEGKRVDNGDSFTAQFTIEDAQKAGLTGRGPWKTYAEDMLYARAMSRLARRLFPDVIGTAYVEGEIRDAKCEIIQEEKTPPEDPVEADAKLDAYMQDFPVEYHDGIRIYISKYAQHWKKGIIQALNDYEEKEKFLCDFLRWKKKEDSKTAVAAA